MLSLFAAISDKLGPFGFFAIRGLERHLSAGNLYSLLAPLALARAAAARIEPLPSFFRSPKSAETIRHARKTYYLSRFPEFFPDRLATAKWADRFQTTGLHHLQEARERGSRVVLVCFHFGTYKLIAFWLRALGIPVIALLEGKSGERSRAKRMKDKLSPFREMPTVIYTGDQLRKTVEHLSAGHVLLLAVDREASKQLTLPIDEQWSFGMATGAIRLAAHCHAELIPCCMMDEGEWRFRLDIGEPVPRRYLTDESDMKRAGQHLLQAMLPLIRARPEACASYLLERFQPNAPAPVAEHSYI